MTIARSSDVVNIDGIQDLESVGGTLELRSLDNLLDINGLNALIQVNGSLVLEDLGSITNIDALSNLSLVGGEVEFHGLGNLMNINGLSGLSTVGGGISIHNISNLTTLQPLANIETFSGPILIGSLPIENLAGLENFDSLGYDIDIEWCLNLKSLEGFPPSVSNLGGGLSIYKNAALTDISALSNVNSIGGTLNIRSNNSLKTLSGLDSLIRVHQFVFVWQNPVLLDCRPLIPLLDNVDDEIPGPGLGDIPDVGLEVVISENQATCNSIELFGDLVSWGDFD